MARRVNSGSSGLTLVLTAEDVGVEGFYRSTGVAGFTGPTPRRNPFSYGVATPRLSVRAGRCPWPFHQPIYGPQTPTLVAPNADLGIDGMVINIAGLLAGAVTNPFGKGYFQGSADVPLEAASACPGAYGKGAYPGYAVDSSSGASYNALGVNRRKFLLPALFYPSTSQCSTIAWLCQKSPESM